MCNTLDVDWSICERCYSGSLVKVSDYELKCLHCGASYTLADEHHVTESKDSGKQNKEEEDYDYYYL